METTELLPVPVDMQAAFEHAVFLGANRFLMGFAVNYAQANVTHHINQRTLAMHPAIPPLHYIQSLPLATALWWFIENVPEDAMNRSELFFALRERYRNEAQAQGGGEVVAWGRFRDGRLVGLGMERDDDAGLSIPLYAAPPSAPVGVVEGLLQVVERRKKQATNNSDKTDGYTMGWSDGQLGFAAEVEQALAQQPAAKGPFRVLCESDTPFTFDPARTTADAPLAQQPAADAYCITREDGECISDDPRCMHNKPAAVDEAVGTVTRVGEFEVQEHRIELDPEFDERLNNMPAGTVVHLYAAPVRDLTLNQLSEVAALAAHPAAVDSALTPTGTFCSVCEAPQHNTPSGVSCPNGHGGVAALNQPGGSDNGR